MCCSNDPSFWRQILVLTSGCFYSIGKGISLAHPSVLNAALLSPNATDIKATMDQASWIASIQGFSGLLGFFIFSPLLQAIGRKPVNIIFQINIIIGWIILYYSNSITMLMVAKSIQGLNMGGVFVVAFTISEFTHRNRRGVFMTIKKTAMSCGSLLCHILALVWDWRQIAALAIIPHLLTLIIFLFCPESPAYYALKGRFAECEKSFVWFHGDSDDSIKEMRLLISAQMEIRKSKDRFQRRNIKFKLLKKLMRRDFLIPFSIATLTTITVDFSGRYFLLGYVTQIMIVLTGDKYIAIYCSIIADCLLIIALFISMFVIKAFKRRTIIFKFGSVSVVLMCLVSLSEVIKKLSSVNVKWITPMIILLHSFVSTAGLIPTSFTISTEVFPLDYRAIGSLTTGIAFTLFYAITMKIVPLMMQTIGIGGTYFTFGLCVTLCLIILYYILPETKDKSLQEIEDEIKGIKRPDDDILILSNGLTRNLKDTGEIKL